MRRVVITGLGTVCPLGVGTGPAWTRLIRGESGIVPFRDGPALRGNPCRIAAYVPLGRRADGRWDPADWPVDTHRMAQFTQFAVAASAQALEDAGWAPQTDRQREATGVCIGSGIGSLDDAYETASRFILAKKTAGYRQVSPYFIPRLLINMASGHISIKYGLRGPNHAASTACATGLHSIGDAARFIACADADVMVAGGAESCIHPVSMAGFARTRSLTTDWNEQPARASRPFDAARSGFVMGEGAGVVVLEELEHALKRKARIYAEVRGYGLSADAHHIIAPRLDGQGPYAAMKRALLKAGLRPRDVDYINAHATSTALGDMAENNAIRRLMLGRSGADEWADREDYHASAGDVNVSSTKGAVGHLLGAAGAVETVFTALALYYGILPPTLNLENPGAGEGVDPDSIAEADQFEPVFDLNYVPNTAQKKDIRVALTNSFGFGGTNASLCLSLVD